jgi:hypothetical protein
MNILFAACFKIADLFPDRLYPPGLYYYYYYYYYGYG